MVYKLGTQKILWLLAALLSLAASMAGLCYPALYHILDPKMLVAVAPQDVMTIIAAVIRTWLPLSPA